MPVAVHRLVRSITPENEGGQNYGFNVCQIGKYIVTVDSNIEASEHIKIGWAHGTPLWKIVCRIVNFSIKNDLFDMSIDQEAEMMRDYMVDEDEPATKEKMKNEAWNQEFWDKAIKDVYTSRALTKRDVRLFGESGLTGRLELMFSDLPSIAAGSNMIEWHLKKNRDPYSEDTYHDRMINQVYWGVDSDSLDYASEERMAIIGDNGVVVANVERYVIENGSVVKVGDGQYVKRREARKTIKDLMEWLEKKRPQLG